MSADIKTPPGGNPREIFQAALEQSDPAKRAAFLDRACAGDGPLRHWVEELLREQADVGSFLETPALSRTAIATHKPALGPGGTVSLARITEKSGDRIGRYKLLQKIGEGGAGIVYMAEQEEPVRRRVALKILKLGMDTKSVIARFEAERQALAMMEHPNIARVFDAGATETGRPYFVMELVRGVKITQYCDQQKLATRGRLALFIQVCLAIQHAHQKGIIHRDIKPSNILVTLHDGIPVPKIIDFGIAKATEHRLTDKTLFTEFSSFIGTPAYMSPEQAEMSGLDIDTRTDIYSLGVLLYELLTGKTPLDAGTLLQSGLDECRRAIRESEPLRPSTRIQTMVGSERTTVASQRCTEAPKLIHVLRRELDWIVMMCLEKDRTRRYATTHELALDVERYLAGDPVLACPPSQLYRLQKFARRHRGTFSAAAAILVTLLAGAGISTWLAVRAIRAERLAHAAQRQESAQRQQAEQERARAEQERASARENEYVADINLAQQSLAAGNYGRAVQLLNKHRPRAGEPDLRGFEWRYLWQLGKGDVHASFPTQEGPVQAMAVSPAGDVLALGLRDQVRVWNLPARTLITNLNHGAISLVFYPDGKKLVTASPNNVRVWSTADWSELETLNNYSGPVALSADATRLAACASRSEGARVWDTANWEPLREFPTARGPLAFSPDGQTLATDAEAGITLWAVDEERQNIVLTGSTNLFARGGFWFRAERLLAFSPDGQWVAAPRNTLSERGVFVLGLWEARTGREEAVLPEDPDHIEHTGAIASLAFSPDGHTLATASMDHSIRLWNLAARQHVTAFNGHLSEVWSVAFSPDGQTLLSGAKDGGVKLWPLHARPKGDLISGAWEPLAFSQNNRLLAAIGREGKIAFFDLATHEPEHQFVLEPARMPFAAGSTNRPPGPPPGSPPPGSPPPTSPPPSSFALSADFKLVGQGLGDGTVKLSSTVSEDATTSLKASDHMVDSVALSPDGRFLVTGALFQAMRWWDLRTGTNAVIETEARRGALFSPDSQLFAAITRGNTIELWNAGDCSLRTKLSSEIQPRFPAAFSPDSRLLAVTCFDDAIRLWDIPTGRLLGVCTGHKQGIHAVAFSPDGKTLATASDDSTLKLWNVATQQELLTIRRLGGALRRLVFSPDGQWLAGGNLFTRTTDTLRFFQAPLASEPSASSVSETTGNAAPTSGGMRPSRPVL